MMEDRKPINPDDNSLYMGYDNLAIDKIDSTQFSSKLIIVQPKSIENETNTFNTDCYLNETNSSSKLSSSSDSIEELDISDFRSANKYQIEDVMNKQKQEEMGNEMIFEIDKYTNVFEEEILVSDLMKTPNPEFPIVNIRDDLRRFLSTPPPRGVLFRCQINKTNKVDKTLYFTNFIFSLQTRDAKSGGNQPLNILMMAYPNRNPKQFTYYISPDPSEIGINAPYIVGQLKSNFLGTRFNIYSKLDSQETSNSINFDEDEADQDANVKKDRNNIGVIFYKSSRFGSGKPRKICVAVPDYDGDKENYFDVNLPQERSKLGEVRDKRCIVLNNIEPAFDEKQKCYVLNFGGRAQEISIKNFALKMNTEGREKRVYQFGKCKKHYIVDFTYPICALQAFAIGLSCCQRKLAPE